MRQMQIIDPKTGKVLQMKIPLHLTQRAKALLIGGVVGVFFFVYFAIQFYMNDWDLLGAIFVAFASGTTMFMYKFYRGIRLWSEMNAQRMVMKLIMSGEMESDLAEILAHNASKLDD